jgi:flagellar L-ring protein precursor FlgH
MIRHRSVAFPTVFLFCAAGSISSCNFFERMSEVGESPVVSRIQDPTRTPNYQPVSMPTPAPPSTMVNSLWRAGSRAFFKDQRAAEIGDLLTVSVDINESGQISNETATATTGSEAAAMPHFLGTAAVDTIDKVFAGADPNSLVSLSSSSGMSGTGTMARSEQVTVNLAATVIRKLPNGNLVIAGKQELRVNGDLRELSIEGIIRIEDISTLNTISSDKIAEAHITYGGHGTLSDIQQPRYGQQIFDIAAPF